MGGQSEKGLLPVTVTMVSKVESEITIRWIQTEQQWKIEIYKADIKEDVTAATKVLEFQIVGNDLSENWATKNKDGEHGEYTITYVEENKFWQEQAGFLKKKWKFIPGIGEKQQKRGKLIHSKESFTQRKD